MPGGNTMVGPVHADSLEQCAAICDRHNATLAGGFSQDGAISTGYSFQHCNAFVFDREKRVCTLKSKRMGNFTPQQGHVECGMHASKPRFVSGYRWESLVNEINTATPNMMSGMQNQPSALSSGGPAWSNNNWGVVQNHCTSATGTAGSGCTLQECPERQLQERGVQLKSLGYDVRPGAIISAKNVTTGPFAHGSCATQVPVRNMQECADLAAMHANGSFPASAPYGGANAWTFHPDYTTSQVTSTEASGTCSLGHVREPYYQTLTPQDNGAISGFALPSLSREIQRFLFG